MENELIKLSSTVINYSLRVKENDRVLIAVNSILPKYFIKCLIKEIVKVRGIPFLRIVDNELGALLTSVTNDLRIKELKKHKEQEVDNYDCFINIRCTDNEYEGKNISSDIRRDIAIATSKSDDIRINKRRWVLLNYPSELDSYKAKLPYDEFKDFALKAMNFDYSLMEKQIEPLKKLMEKTKMVRIVSPGTDLTFSIKNMPVIPCCGESNIPDGEIYTAPVKDSVNGVITYNTPSPYHGEVYNNVSLRFQDGKIVSASCNEDSEKLNRIFDIDEGARYVGEFALGLNPLIKDSMGDILFDEKIIGSLHFTPGRCYANCDNGNNSGIHWDMVLIQTKEYGGGDIYFDDVLVRKDGLFVLPELLDLNYGLKLNI